MTRRSTESELRELIKQLQNQAGWGDIEAALATRDVLYERVIRATATGHKKARRLAMLALAATSTCSRTLGTKVPP